ncbi:MAG: hypothetical protein NZ928_00535 [Endomicrobia bacterium]|nr:hypothetical protein [Endomicrobiia bacterium]MDW8056588.1 hypothetical protein [Elusimicrobiota bacterium]
MKKTIVILLIFSQFLWGVGFVEFVDRCELPSLSTILKVVWLSFKTHISNLINIYYIFSHLPQKDDQKKEEHKKLQNVIITTIESHRKLKFFELFLQSKVCFLLNKIFCVFLLLFLSFTVIFNIERIYYFILPRSSI